jgi:hypothetical protein
LWAVANSPGFITCKPEYSQPTQAEVPLRPGFSSAMTRRPAFSGLTRSSACSTSGRIAR